MSDNFSDVAGPFILAHVVLHQDEVIHAASNVMDGHVSPELTHAMRTCTFNPAKTTRYSR